MFSFYACAFVTELRCLSVTRSDNRPAPGASSWRAFKAAPVRVGTRQSVTNLLDEYIC